MNMITVKATSVRDNKNGTFTLEFPSVEIAPATQKILEDLFPDLLDGAYTLLNKQALLRLIATPAETAVEPNNCHNCGQVAPLGEKYCDKCRNRKYKTVDPVS